MRKKITNNRLLIVFVVLLGLVVVLFTNEGAQKERSFEKQLTDFEKDAITEIRLFPKKMNGESISIFSKADKWEIESEGASIEADQSAVSGLINTLFNLEAKSLISKSKDNWDKYEVTDSLASRVQVFKGTKKIADVYIGKFQFSQPRNMSTYVRLNKQKEVFKVDGFLTSTFNRNVTELRDKTLLKTSVDEIQSVAFNYPSDSSFVLTRDNSEWLVDGVTANNTEVETYLRKLSNQKATQVYDQQVETLSNLYQIVVTLNSGEKVELNVVNEHGKELLNSSVHEALWYDDTARIEQLFVSPSKFKIN